MIDAESARLAIVISTAASTRQAAAAEIADAWMAARPGSAMISAPPAAVWPFMYPLHLQLPSTPAIVLMTDVHEAFVNHQTASTHLVTTQPGYLMQAWLDAMKNREVLLLATADRATLAKHAPEVLARRGPFAAALIEDNEATLTGDHRDSPQKTSADPAQRLLVAAVRAEDPAKRLALCVQALDLARTPPALLTAASACMEVNNLNAAGRDLDEALDYAPAWAAAHFERGKLWLRCDEMERASESFREAATRMPQFAAAWANLGAALGELDRADEALGAFEHALRCDPSSHQALNNIGVVSRELGKLAESEVAFHRVIALVPELAFGHYNLGHTLFLQGRYQAALAAYVEGQKRDPERNPVQASRLAVCRLASGDAGGALSELQRATSGLPRDYRQQLLADVKALTWALLTHRPDLPGWKQVHVWLSGQLAALEADSGRGPSA